MSHIPDRAAVLADKLVVNMKAELRANPIIPPGLYMNKKPQNLVCHIIRSDQEQGTPEGSSEIQDEFLIADVELALLSQVERTLFHYHSKLLGRVLRSWEDYDPQQILSTLPGVDSVLVLDSLNLPENWKDIGPRSLLHWGRNLLQDRGSGGQ